VLGVKERGGRMHTEVIPDTKKVTLRAIVNETVQKGSIVSTDELAS
jgi:transposase-like protein